MPDNHYGPPLRGTVMPTLRRPPMPTYNQAMVLEYFAWRIGPDIIDAIGNRNWSQAVGWCRRREWIEPCNTGRGQQLTKSGNDALQRCIAARRRPA